MSQQAAAGQLIDVSIKDEPFWPAFLKMCTKANLRPYSEWNQPTRVSLQSGSPLDAKFPTATAGSCLIVLESITSRFDADLTGPRPPTRSLNVNFQLYVEPKLSPYRISSIATLETAIDEKGNNLVRPRQQWDDRQGGGPQSIWQRDVNCNLLFPDNAGDRIKTLKGYCSVAIAGPEKTETIDQPLGKKNLDIKIDTTLVKLVELRKRGAQYEARMAGDINSPVFKDYERFSKILKLIDNNGKELASSGGSWGGRAREHDGLRPLLQRQRRQRAAERAARDPADGDQGDPRAVRVFRFAAAALTARPPVSVVATPASRRRRPRIDQRVAGATATRASPLRESKP
jgi:hypothetical protein